MMKVMGFGRIFEKRPSVLQSQGGKMRVGCEKFHGTLHDGANVLGFLSCYNYGCAQDCSRLELYLASIHTRLTHQQPAYTSSRGIQPYRFSKKHACSEESIQRSAL